VAKRDSFFGGKALKKSKLKSVSDEVSTEIDEMLGEPSIGLVPTRVRIPIPSFFVKNEPK
jgi:hypothetical protein